MAMGALSDQEVEGTGSAGNHSSCPNPMSCKRTPRPGLQRIWEGGSAWRAGLAKLKELEEGQGWRGPEGGHRPQGPSQNPQEDNPTLVYNALLAKLTNE